MEYLLTERCFGNEEGQLSSEKPAALVVDANDQSRESIVRALEQERYFVTATSSGSGTFAILEQKRFALVLIDLDLEGALDGISLYDLICQSGLGEKSAIVFISPEQLSPRLSAFLERTDRPCLRRPFSELDCAYLARNVLRQAHIQALDRLRANVSAPYVLGQESIL